MSFPSNNNSTNMEMHLCAESISQRIRLLNPVHSLLLNQVSNQQLNPQTVRPSCPAANLLLVQLINLSANFKADSFPITSAHS